MHSDSPELTAGPPSTEELTEHFQGGSEPLVPEPDGTGRTAPPPTHLAADDPAHPPVEGTLPPSPESDRWIVVHTNRFGHHFATRVDAADADAAREALGHAHEDNDVIDVVPDDGRGTHAVGGTMLRVTDLGEEP